MYICGIKKPENLVYKAFRRGVIMGSFKSYPLIDIAVRMMPPARRSTQGIADRPILAPSFMPLGSVPSEISFWRLMRCAPIVRIMGQRKDAIINKGSASNDAETASDVIADDSACCTACDANIEESVLIPIVVKLLMKWNIIGRMKLLRFTMR